MEPGEPAHRLARIHAALEAGDEIDLQRVPAQVTRSGSNVAIHQDFSGEWSPADLENFAYSQIQNVASLTDHSRAWARRNRVDRQAIDGAFNASFAIKVIADLANNDKHGYPPRDGGHSGRSPQLVNVRRILRLQVAPGATAGLTFTANGITLLVGDGDATAIVTGDIVDASGVPVGDLRALILEATKDWETILSLLGAIPSDE